ncbi:NARE ribosyltransferase, partial [Climacteris rufus]|nr:NARE ribosyltransferase [Climacteris rufus]
PLPSMEPLVHTLVLLAMAVATVAIEVVPLDMAPYSFDDQYEGCRPAMTAALPALNRSDVQQNEKFAQVWQKATKEWRKRGSPVSPLASPAQAIALMAYTMPELYEEFNAAVRTAGRSSREYRDNFHFKTLHFLLTDALGTLRGRQGELCRCVAQQVDRVWFEAQRGQRVRFGHFMSVSLCKGGSVGVETQTVLHMVSCQGVDIKGFSFLPDKDEVLIPPFETFEVTDVTEDGGKISIMLDLTKTHSNYNCEFLRGDSAGTAWGGR